MFKEQGLCYNVHIFALSLGTPQSCWFGVTSSLFIYNIRHIRPGLSTEITLH